MTDQTQYARHRGSRTPGRPPGLWSLAAGLVLGFVVLSGLRAEAQGTFVGDGTFVNLDFEQGNVPAGHFSAVPVSQALPGWTAYLGDTPVTSILPNDVSLSGASVSIITPQWGAGTVFQGNYMVLIQAAEYPSSLSPTTAAIAQTGQIPSNAQFIVFEAKTSGLELTFNGSPLTVSSSSPHGSYTVYEAGVSSFAGQTGELRFTCPQVTGFGSIYLDDIGFYAVSAPEPGSLALLAAGGLILALGQRRPPSKV